MHPDHPRSLRDQCEAAGVDFYLKQWGEWSPIETEGKPVRMAIYNEAKPGWMHGLNPKTLHYPENEHFKEGVRMYRVGKNKAGHLLDDVEHRPEF